MKSHLWQSFLTVSRRISIIIWEQYNWRANSKICRFFPSFSLILSKIPNEIWLSLIYITNFSPKRFWIWILIGNLIKHKKVFPWKNWILAWIWAIIRDLLSKESTSIKIHIIATADLPEFPNRWVWLNCDDRFSRDPCYVFTAAYFIERQRIEKQIDISGKDNHYSSYEKQ